MQDVERKYRWVPAWCIVAKPDELVVGQQVTIERKDKPEQTATVTALLPFTTRKGEDRVRAFVAVDQ